MLDLAVPPLLLRFQMFDQDRWADPSTEAASTPHTSVVQRWLEWKAQTGEWKWRARQNARLQFWRIVADATHRINTREFLRREEGTGSMNDWLAAPYSERFKMVTDGRTPIAERSHGIQRIAREFVAIHAFAADPMPFGHPASHLAEWMRNSELHFRQMIGQAELALLLRALTRTDKSRFERFAKELLLLMDDFRLAFLRVINVDSAASADL